MSEKLNKPLIIITAALSIAVITLSVQVVLLTFSVKDQKDTVKQLQARTNTAYAVENRYTELNGSLQQLRRDFESLKNETISISAEINSLREIISKINTDSQFIQLELNNISNRMIEMDKQCSTTISAAQSVSLDAEAEGKDATSQRSESTPTSYHATSASQHESTNALEPTSVVSQSVQ